MNILLVQAYLGGSEPPVFPIGLSCIASAVKGHELKVFDPNVAANPFSEMVETLASFKPEIVGISLRNIDSTNKRKVVFYYKLLKKMIDIIKAGPCSGVKIIIGGSGFSMFAHEIMQDEPRIDYGVYLEGERTFPELLEQLEHPGSVKGVLYREGGKIIFTGPNIQTDLNAVQLPDRAIIGISAYIGAPDSIGIETKRGCMLGCVYCVYGFLNGKNMRLKNPVRVVDEIEALTRDMQLQSFTFVDSVFNIPLSHAEAICREIIRRRLKVSWSAWFHEDRLTEKFVKLAVDAGCNKLILSPDGFSDKTLRKLGKSIKKQDILEVFNLLKNMRGFEVCYNFFKNPPGQDLFTFLKLMRFYVITKLRLGKRAHFEFNAMRIEPHTGLYKIALEEGLIKKEDNLLYPKYYTSMNTRYIEQIFNTMLLLKGK